MHTSTPKTGLGVMEYKYFMLDFIISNYMGGADKMIKTYGQQQAGKQPSEAAEMTTFFNQLKKRYPEIHALALHVRNEGKRDHKDTNIMKMQGGFVKGAPDIVIAGSPTFLCEMKSKAKTSRIAKEQTSFLERADRAGCFCCVAYGWEAAMEAVEEWVKENPL